MLLPLPRSRLTFLILNKQRLVPTIPFTFTSFSSYRHSPLFESQSRLSPTSSSSHFKLQSQVRYTTTLNMSEIADFVTAAQRADPSLAGSDDKATIDQLSAETESLTKDLAALNDKLTPITYLYKDTPSSADISLYCRLHSIMAEAPATQHPTYPAILRYFLHIQSLPAVTSAHSTLPNSFPPLSIPIETLPAPPRQAPAPKVKKEKKPAAVAGAGVTEQVRAAGEAVGAAVAATVSAAAATVGQVAEAVGSAVGVGAGGEKVETGEKKEKKQKEKKEKAPAPVKEEPTGPLPSMIDMRVGKILDVKRHPDADSLYVESIDVGEPEPRQVCSGLVKYMTEDEIRDQTVVVICNLKPVTMRGVKSFAMLLCASSSAGKEEGGVEFVLPPAGSKPGERIYFEGEKYENAQPEAQLNPKKKVFETIQPGFITLDTLEAAWVDPETKTVHKIRTKDGVCKAKSFIGASLS